MNQTATTITVLTLALAAAVHGGTRRESTGRSVGAARREPEAATAEEQGLRGIWVAAGPLDLQC